MFIKQVDKVTRVLIERKIITVDNRETVNYGLSTGIELILNLITTLTIGYVLNMVLESIVFLLSFAYVRVYTGGYHLKKAINCYLVSNGVVVLVLLTVMLVAKKYIIFISLILLGISVPIILKFSPVGTPNKSLNTLEKNHYRKKALKHLGIEVLFVFAFFSLRIHNIALVIILGVFVSSSLIVISLISNRFKRLYTK